MPKPEDTTPEKWRTIPGWEGFYEVSSLGRVRSLKRMAPAMGRGHERTVPRKILTQQKGGRYARVQLSRRGEKHMRTVNRLIAEAFHGAPPTPAHHAAHNNGDAFDNRASNLRWATAKENCADRTLHGTEVRGKRVNTAKLTADNVREIRKRAAGGEPHTSIAADYPVGAQNIGHIARRKSWRHI